MPSSSCSRVWLLFRYSVHKAQPRQAIHKRYFWDMEEHKEDEGSIREIIVDEGQRPLRLDKYLIDRMQFVTRNKIQNGIKDGSVLVNETQVKSNYKVRPLDLITIVIPPSRNSDEGIEAQDIPLDIIYEDNDVLVVNKPAGMVVHPGISNPDNTLVNAVAYHIESNGGEKLPGSADDRPGLVHRIDKDTSGLLVLAKNDYALSELAKQFFDHSIHRKYLALVWGCPDPEAGTVDEYIGRHPKDRTKQFVFEDRDQGKHAITHYKVEEDLYYVSLVSCQLETGRTHQIRVHMRFLGHPLFNDATYDGKSIRKGTVFSKYKQFVFNAFELIRGQALHAAELAFTHPVTKERMHFEADLPEGFDQLMKKWRSYLSNRKSHQ